MIDGLNPRHGYHAGAAYPYPDPLAYGYGQPMNNDVPFDAPIGHQWVDITVLPPLWSPAGAIGPAFLPQYPPPYGFPTGPGMPFCSGGQASNGGMPGVHFKNSHGGIGCEPGYDYLFPPSHTKVHVITSKEAPWKNTTRCTQRCFNVPTGLAVKDVMQQFGCDNKVAAKNKLHELTQGGDGRWYKGITISGNQPKEMAKKIELVGWNKDRDGIKQDFVWLWFQK